MRNIFVVTIMGENFVYIKRGKNTFLFTQKELNDAKQRYLNHKDVIKK